MHCAAQISPTPLRSATHAHVPQPAATSTAATAYEATRQLQLRTDGGRERRRLTSVRLTVQLLLPPLLCAYRRRPRRPPFLRVLSVGMGVTSSAGPREQGVDRGGTRTSAVKIQLGMAVGGK